MKDHLSEYDKCNIYIYHSRASYFALYLECSYTPMDGPTMGNNRGKTVKSHKQISDLQTCTALCDEETKCESLLYHSEKKICTLKDKLLDGSEQIVKKNKVFFSVFKSCREG